MESHEKQNMKKKEKFVSCTRTVGGEGWVLS